MGCDNHSHPFIRLSMSSERDNEIYKNKLILQKIKKVVGLFIPRHFSLVFSRNCHCRPTDAGDTRLSPLNPFTPETIETFFTGFR